MTSKKILVTTPDYPPKLGGLSTFSINLVVLLEEEGYEVSIFNWEGVKEARNSYEKHKDYDLYFHIHYLGGFLGAYPTSRSVNFCHGSELFFKSPNRIKNFIKKLLRKNTIKYFESSKENVFISKFTRGVLEKRGFRVDYSRDIIFHNCIPLPLKKPSVKSFSDKGPIKICSIARDVPHKNLNGVYKLAEYLAEISNRPIQLSITSNRFKSSDKVIIKDINKINDEELEKVYSESDFNVLLSKDHSDRGFVEGFGLTTLEASKYGTPSLVLSSGGLNENIHHNFNGYKFETINRESVLEFYSNFLVNYKNWSKNCFEHLESSHSMPVFKKLIDKLVGGRSE